MKLALILLAAVLPASVLHDQLFTLTLPSGAHAVKSTVNFETDAYDIRDARDREIATIFAGGGAYDLHGYRRYCLHGSVAWFRDDGRSGTLVVGSPGVNSVSLAYSRLDDVRLRAIKTMIASIRMLHSGSSCRT